MKMEISPVWRFLFLGASLAAISAAISSIVFYITDTLCLIIFSPDIHLADMINGSWLDLEIVIGIFLITLLPAILGGFILACLQQRDARLERLTTKRGMIEGGILGSAAALLCSAGLISFLVFYGRRIPALSAVLIHVINALVIAMLAGMWAGRILSQKMQRTSRENLRITEKSCADKTELQE
jgi:hypothetical protein